MEQYLIYAIMLVIGILIGRTCSWHRETPTRELDHIKQRSEIDRELLDDMCKKDIQITELMKYKIDADFEKSIGERE